jgi:hypothetical protein
MLTHCRLSSLANNVSTVYIAITLIAIYIANVNVAVAANIAISVTTIVVANIALVAVDAVKVAVTVAAVVVANIALVAVGAANVAVTVAAVVVTHSLRRLLLSSVIASVIAFSCFKCARHHHYSAE